MCPDENTLLQFARGEAGTELTALETHLDGCESCRKTLAAAASKTTLPATLPSSHQLVPGQRINRYEIERELGRGGMGIVYQARDVTLDRRVALKLLHARGDEVAQARLLREAQVMARLAHPHVVPVFELGEWHREIYLVMELVTGVTLEAWLKRQKNPRSEILRKFIDAGRGLAAAHASGVVHRDFKPANVLVGLDDRVRVTDFGLSRPGPSLELPATDSLFVTRDGTIVGTLAYMAPEQIDGRTADERSDQFAFCVALAEALQGSRPFVGERWVDLAQSLTRKPQLTGVPLALRSILARGLQRDPARRFTSMTALLNALERAQKLGWKSVALTGAVAAAAVAVLSFFPMIQASVRGPAPVAKWVSVVQAQVDIPQGTPLTMDMVMQRAVAEDQFNDELITPDKVQYAIGQPINRAVQKGHTLQWEEFARDPASEAQAMVTVVVARHDLAAGVTLIEDMFETRAFPANLVTSSVLRPDSSKYFIGKTLNVGLMKGDTLLWTQFTGGPFDASEHDADRLSQSVGATLYRTKPKLIECFGADKASAVIRFAVDASGLPKGLGLEKENHVTAETSKCLLSVMEGMRFVPSANGSGVTRYAIGTD